MNKLLNGLLVVVAVPLFLFMLSTVLFEFDVIKRPSEYQATTAVVVASDGSSTTISYLDARGDRRLGAGPRRSKVFLGRIGDRLEVYVPARGSAAPHGDMVLAAPWSWSHLWWLLGATGLIVAGGMWSGSSKRAVESESEVRPAEPLDNRHEQRRRAQLRQAIDAEIAERLAEKRRPPQ